MIRTVLVGVWIVLGLVSFGYSLQSVSAQSADTPEPIVQMFGRDDCGFCKKQFAWLESEGIPYVYRNIVDDAFANEQFKAVAAKHDASLVTPLTVIGERVILGYNGSDTTGASIKAALEAARNNDIRSVEDHLARAQSQDVQVGGGCTGIACDAGTPQGYIF